MGRLGRQARWPFRGWGLPDGDVLALLAVGGTFVVDDFKGAPDSDGFGPEEEGWICPLPNVSRSENVMPFVK